jgi:hypothetical protein
MKFLNNRYKEMKVPASCRTFMSNELYKRKKGKNEKGE